MKKTLIALTTTLIAASAFGQGTVNFANSFATAVSNSLTMARLVSTEFRVSLYFLPDTGITPTTQMFDTLGLVVATTNFSSAVNGVFAGGVVRVNEIVPAGGSGWFQVRAWEIAFGNSYQEAASAPASGGRMALVGTSNIMKVDTGDPTTVPAGTATPLVNAGLQAFFVTPVPEPSTLALGALGLSALLFLRRHKK